MSAPERERIAVVGAGVAGLTAAYLLVERHDVTLYEQAPVLGGHAHTFTLTRGPDAGTPLDVGFMILNDVNYPGFYRLLERLGGLALLPSEMSFGYQSLDRRVSYALNLRPGYAASVLGARGGTAARPPEPALLHQIVRFFRLGARDLASGTLGDTPYGDYLTERGFDERFKHDYALPMGAALWSLAPRDVWQAPAAFVLGFYAHHGMLSLDEGPRWQTVAGGSQRYVERIAAALGKHVVTNAGVTAIRRNEHGAIVTSAAGATAFDRVVVATHADTALRLLQDPTPDETRLLGAWRYQHSHAVLHTDESLMPVDRASWASWNYVQTASYEATTGPTLSYHLDRLQARPGLTRSYFLTLNPAHAIAEAHVHAHFDFEHPVYTRASVASRQALSALAGTRRTYFCGSYLGAGFHEDAVRAGAAVALSLGVSL